MSKAVSARRARALAGYAVALLFCAGAGLTQHLLDLLLRERFPSAVFTVAVVGGAWYGGFGPGLFGTLVAALTLDYFFLAPAGTLAIERSGDIVGLLLFVLTGVLVSFAARHLRRNIRQERILRVHVERRLRRTRQLQDLTSAVSKARTPTDVVQASLADLLHAVTADAGTVGVIDEAGGACAIVHAVGHSDEAAAGHTISLSTKTLIAEAIRRHELLTLESRGAAVVDFPELAIDPFLLAFGSAAIVPLLTGGRAVGVITLSFAEHRVLAGDERELLLDAGRRTAQALERARLYETADRARLAAEDYRARADQELRERQRVEAALRDSEVRYRGLAARTNRLYALSAGLSEAVTVDAVAKVTVHQGKIALGASAGSIALLSEEREFEVLYRDDRPMEPGAANERFPAIPGLCESAAVSTCRPVFVGTFAEWQKQYPRSALVGADGGYASTAALPLLVDGAPIGVLSFYFTVPVNFDDEYRPLMTAVAQHCAQALDRARLYETSQRARAEAEAANRSKDDFLSTVSHELRTPLNAMLGWTSMLRDGSLDAKRMPRAIEAIYNNATRQARLIEELLDVSRIVAGHVPLDLHELSLGENIRGAIDAIMPLAEARDIDLRLEAVPDVQVIADPHRLEQVFMNLLANAVKFTPQGGRVTVGADVGQRLVAIRVQDTGRGIDPAFLPHVFDRFRQAESTTVRSVGGLGLGLFIARQLVEAHHGEIAVESEGRDRGATFTVMLPIAERRGAVAHPPSAPLLPARRDPSQARPSLIGVHVLLVDDEGDAREMMTAALEASGATVLSAACAQDALQRLTAGADRIDVLLADIAMPEQDGYELIREVRRQPRTAVAQIPAAAVTARAGEDERQRALAAGFQMHLAKPVRPHVLVEAVAELAQAVT